MKIILLTVIALLNVILTEEKLVTTVRKLTTKKEMDVTPYKRHTRDAFDYDTVTGLSKEETEQSDEFLHGSKMKQNHFYNNNELQQFLNSAPRMPRESIVNNTNPANISISNATVEKNKPILIKKPIPKFADLEYDDDFQGKIDKSAIKIPDSGEHEDEDFNVGDYEFDINHDEFAGRQKPLEPRIKNKDDNIFDDTMQNNLLGVIPNTKMNSKILTPEVAVGGTNIKQRNTLIEKVKKDKGDKDKEDEYYDESGPKEVSKYNHHLDDDFTNDHYGPTRAEKASLRAVRSPWKIPFYIDKLGEKSSSFMSKVFGVLPIFPSVSYIKPLHSEELSPNAPMVDPLNGQIFQS